MTVEKKKKTEGWKWVVLKLLRRDPMSIPRLHINGYDWLCVRHT